MRAAAVIQRDDGTPDRTEEREVLYPWHPWFGRFVRIAEVIEKGDGDVFRCAGYSGARERCLEYPGLDVRTGRLRANPDVNVAFCGYCGASCFAGFADRGVQRSGGWRLFGFPGFGRSLGLSRRESERAPCDGRPSVIINLKTGASSPIVPIPRHRRRPAPTGMGDAPAANPPATDRPHDASDARSQGGSAGIAERRMRAMKS